MNNITTRHITYRLLGFFLLLLTLGSGNVWGQTSITSLSQITDADGHYIINGDISGGTSGVAAFNGILEAAINPETHMPYRITGLSAPLFTTLTGTVRNLVLENVGISGNEGNTGAIAGTANGAARIYNVGILSGEVGGTTNTGGLVGFLDGTARVVNCYSYANITGGTNKGGLVGNNNIASSQSNVATMVMNCMFYGTISSGGTISPIYGGQNIDNKNSGGLATYNYYLYRTDLAVTDNKYNCALAVEEKFLNRFEFFRQLENSNKKLASIYATGSAENADQKMLKWVLETADRTIENPHPYPILKAQGSYPSIINYDAENASDSTSVGRNHGGKLGKTLTVHIGGVGSNAPSGASILRRGAIKLERTDKDFDRFNFNYDKVQLPYYNDVGTGNYTENRVVTGWKITSITGGTAGTYTAADAWGGYNFADRNCTNKDLYSVSGRVFSQGAYFEVPYGVTAITIEPYWGVAAYVSDQYYDVVYKEQNNNNYSGQNVDVASAGLGVQASNNTNITLNGSTQKVYTSIDNARKSMSIPTSGKTVYDYAVVLVGNVHQAGTLSGETTPYTITSVDLDKDNEPDYSFIFGHYNRQPVSPIRFDFLNVVGTAQAQKPNGTSVMLNVSIFKPKGWFEVTNTCNIYFVQFEGDNGSKTSAPIIFLGGVFDQFTSTQNQKVTTSTKYIHLGSNCWFKAFGNGTHSDGWSFTSHVPISVTGGDFEGFYLSGVYRPDAGIQQDDAECYISSGRFNEVAGAAQQMIDGDVHWQIYNADITNFYGGGINAAKPITGDITVDITNSYVDTYCGGPKFGDMQKAGTTFTTKYSTNQAGTSTSTYSRAITKDGKVTTNATRCEFNKFFGAGYGGTSYSELKFHDSNTYNFNTLQDNYINDRGKYFNGQNTSYKSNYGNKGPGVATDFRYEFFIWSSGKVGARFYVKYASFSLAQCNDVESNLEKCIINDNFYGGGSIGKVNGTATSVLNDCTVEGNVYAGGYSASLPSIPVRNGGFTTIPKFNNQSGMFEPGVLTETTDFDWTSGTLTENTTALNTAGGKHDIYTNTELTNLGEVANTVLTINGTTTVGKSVYGGGEESGVGGNTEVNVNSGTIGSEGNGGVEYGNVYGGGKGKDDNVTAGLVKGSTKVAISNGTIYHNVYGGGAYGSVGDFDYDSTTGLPTGLKTTAAENSGKTEVYITGGTFGWNGKENGMVFGSSRGDVGAPGNIEDKMAWVYDTHVAIGDTVATTTSMAAPTIRGSVYGGGENGHNLHNSYVRINGGTIGVPTGDNVVVTNSDNSSTTYEPYNYPYRGNVYGGGCGTDKYYSGAVPDGSSANDGNGDSYNPLAGIVKGNAAVNITAGYVVHNVYGAGAMGSVGNGVSGGKTAVNISGGRIGYDGSRNGNVFGAARGEYGISTAASNLANVRTSGVNIAYTTTPTSDDNEKTTQLITGSVFGGGEAGTVKDSVIVKMTGGLILKDIYGGGALADTQTSNWDEDNETWAEGKTSASAKTTLRLTGGTILGEAFGGGLGEAGKPAYVYGDVLLDLNGTTTSGDTGTSIDGDERGCAVREVFGCNNAAGSPMGKVRVHVYATQHMGKSQIANTSGETPVTDAKVKGSYDVLAVYGGGNLAAYEPAGGKNTTNSTDVIIDGCGLTSIQYVYGGGNAASTPATKVTVNGTYEIEELFGGGNGKDSIVVNNVKLANPGANVGFYAYEDSVVGKSDTKENRATYYGYGTGQASVNVFGGTVHRVFGGSNTKGNVRQTAVTLLDENSGCDFCIDEAYGGGKSAPMDAEAKLLMACIPGLQAAYGGAEDADIHDNVTLTITNGTFDRVFGGNNKSGKINGSITVNVEEVGCRPIIIGELYGGGNLAAYSVYGYNSDDTPKDSGTKLYNDPEVNVRSFTSIGTVYGGGYGTPAVMVGSPTVNINEIVDPTSVAQNKSYVKDATTKYYSDYAGETKTIAGHEVVLPSHEKGKMGSINNVFGGGNAAMVKGNTTVNIGTAIGEDIYIVVPVTAGTDLTSKGYYTRSGDVYTAATGTATADTTYYKKFTILGVDIRGNVYGGGNNAEVTGNANVVVGTSAE